MFPLAAAVLTAAPAWAQDAPETPVPGAATPLSAPVVAPQVLAEPEVGVDELVRRALANNPQLPVARQTLEATRERLGAARALPGPTLELVPRIVGSREAADSEVILSQPLDVFGQRRARANVARAEVRRAQAERALAERGLIVQVKNAAADLFAAQEAESLGQAQVEVAQLFRRAAARRAEGGDVPRVQVQRAELELLRVQNELSNAQAERLARRAALNQLVGQAPETPLRVALPQVSGLADVLRASSLRASSLRAGSAGVSSSGAVAGSAAAESAAAGNVATGQIPALPPAQSRAPGGGAGATPDALKAAGVEPSSAPLLGSSAQAGSNLVGLRGQVLPLALASRPDVAGAQATLEARQAQVQVLRRSQRPAVELQARRGAFFGQKGSYALRAVVTLPLFDFGAIRRERRALEAEARAQQATIDLLRSQVAAQVEQALIRLQQGQQTVARYRTGIVPLTLDLLRKTQIGYAQGASTYLEVLEAQRTLRQVQTEYLQALVGARTQEAALEGALGSAPGADLLGGLSNLSNLSYPSGPVAPPGTSPPGVIAPGTIPTVPQEPLPQASTTSTALPISTGLGGGR